MNKIMVIGLLAVLLIGFASSYICIYPSHDIKAVQDFKTKINKLAIQEDINNGITEEGLKIKLKYFSPCR